MSTIKEALEALEGLAATGNTIRNEIEEAFVLLKKLEEKFDDIEHAVPNGNLDPWLSLTEEINSRLANALTSAESISRLND